ncbi:ferritin-like metal-binding protein YciE [Prauserella shujinwangii]|uniref:Ferritin-like metal-binding protein YciE n=1 Tax=Prauserella shujinwangii TaxID=1453103 RepID=A0A2T0M188_9PSEU|nr:DUF892 family protein [Prauserella shujinwangii]PRX50331.1 ferritin-like metal-binding protein YciE [Prauserella shujinwangii]
MSHREQVINWLNDAYAMEQALEETLQRHAQDAQGENEEVQTRIERHIEETRGQAQIVRECIEALGGQVSGVKSAFATMFGAMQGQASRPAGDTMVKNAIADYAAEHFEIATYRALIDAAERIGEREIADRLRGILQQEEEMARFLEQKLPGAVEEKLAASAR